MGGGIECIIQYFRQLFFFSFFKYIVETLFTAHPFPSTGNTSLGMVQAVEGFLVHHAAISGRVLKEHFNFKCGTVENHVTVGVQNKDLEICKRRIEMFSHPSEWVLDINVQEGMYVWVFVTYSVQ